MTDEDGRSAVRLERSISRMLSPQQADMHAVIPQMVTSNRVSLILSYTAAVGLTGRLKAIPALTSSTIQALRPHVWMNLAYQCEKKRSECSTSILGTLNAITS